MTKHLLSGLALLALATSPLALADAPPACQPFVLRNDSPLPTPIVQLKTSLKPPLRLVVDGQTIPCHVSPAGLVSFVLPGDIKPNQPRIVQLFADSVSPSPLLPEPPQPRDFATDALQRPWTFAQDDAGASMFGDKPDHIGPRTFDQGWMNMTVMKNDPYIVWGSMFAPNPPDSKFILDSNIYRQLVITLKQDQPDQTWGFFFTQTTGAYHKHTFRVAKTGETTLTFDLKNIYRDRWDGRTYRAFRLDLPKKQIGLNAGIKSIRLLSIPLSGQPLPVISSAQRLTLAALAQLTDTTIGADAAVAGTDVGFSMTLADAQGKPLPAHAAQWFARFTQETTGQRLEQRGNALTDAQGQLSITLQTPPRVGQWQLELGLATDMGDMSPQRLTRTLTVKPAPLHSIQLKTSSCFQEPGTRLSCQVQGYDVFGNHVALNIASPRWETTGGLHVEAKPLLGSPATCLITMPKTPATSCQLKLTYNQNQATSLTLLTHTTAKRQDRISIAANGYLVTADGQLFFPTGGLYANWPHSKPQDDTSYGRTAVDLFPCGVKAYTAGFPWSPEIEQKVDDYLDHCRENKLTALRLMLRNMDHVGKVDDIQLMAVLHFIKKAYARGIRINVTLLEDYSKPPYGNIEVLEKIILPHYTEDELASLPPHRRRFLVEKRLLKGHYDRYTDEDAIRCQEDYLRQLIPILAAQEGIFCYEFENEMTRSALPYISRLSALIRSLDPQTLLLVNPHPIVWPMPLEWRDAPIDLFCDHPYTSGTDGADRGAAILTRAKWCLASGKTALTGEGGIFTGWRWHKPHKVPLDICLPEAKRAARDFSWMVITAGLAGTMHWTVELASEPAELGRPATVFSQLGIDLRTFNRRRGDVALIMPADNAQNNAAMDQAYQLLQRGICFDTVPADEATSYPASIAANQQDPALLERLPVFAKPFPGYQTSILRSTDGQVLIYLRNVAGMHRPADPYGGPNDQTRLVRPALPGLTLAADAVFTNAKAYDLEDAKVVPLKRQGQTLELPVASTHDYVIYLNRN